MRWHPDPDCDAAIIRLLDALCTWERNTGRESFAVIIPVESEEKVVVADSGKPLSGPSLTRGTICSRVQHALAAHDNPHVHNFIDCDENGDIRQPKPV